MKKRLDSPYRDCKAFFFAGSLLELDAGERFWQTQGTFLPLTGYSYHPERNSSARADGLPPNRRTYGGRQTPNRRLRIRRNQ